MDSTTGGSPSGSDGVPEDFVIRLREVTLRLPVGRRAGRGPHQPPGTVGAPLAATRGALLEVVALENVSLTIRQGQRVGIIGHNGAGKTVLLRVMAGIYSPTSGVCETRGRLATMFSTAVGSYLDATGLEYITLIGLTRGLGRKEIERHLPDIIHLSEITDYVHLPLRTYSAGMRARLMFAVAVCIDWDVLLIDEDIGASDPRFRSKVGEHINGKVADTHTLVVASQSEKVIREFCDVAVWIHKGRVRRTGGVDELLDAYLSEQLELHVPAAALNRDKTHAAPLSNKPGLPQISPKGIPS